MYRPPSGNSTEALNELKKIIEQCPKNNVHLIGDFNIDLHDENTKLVQDFENLILGLGLSPLISTYTHHKPGCKQSCIDNILTTNIENSVYSGSISTCISHHHAVFHIFKSPLVSNEAHEQKYTQYYDYCGTNVDHFVKALDNDLLNRPPENFTDFVSVFNQQLDNACKLEQPKCSKRTARNNPWITSGLINSIKRKHELYELKIKAGKKACE